jgi:hypothetical protein
VTVDAGFVLSTGDELAAWRRKTEERWVCTGDGETTSHDVKKYGSE